MSISLPSDQAGRCTMPQSIPVPRLQGSEKPPVTEGKPRGEDRGDTAVDALPPMKGDGLG